MEQFHRFRWWTQRLQISQHTFHRCCEWITKPTILVFARYDGRFVHRLWNGLVLQSSIELFHWFIGRAQYSPISKLTVLLLQWMSNWTYNCHVHRWWNHLVCQTSKRTNKTQIQWWAHNARQPVNIYYYFITTIKWNMLMNPVIEQFHYFGERTSYLIVWTNRF